MKKVIRITNEPRFNRGVKSYVGQVDVKKQTYATTPDIGHAKDFTEYSEIQILEVLYFIKQGFSKATVEIVEI